MEENLKNLKELLKSSLETNYKIDRNHSPCNLSIIQDYSFQETHKELKFLIDSLLLFKKSAKKQLKNRESPKSLSSQSRETSDNLKEKLNLIKKKYLLKVKNLISDSGNTQPSSPIKKHRRMHSSFKIINNRHSGSEQCFDKERKILSDAVASISKKTKRNL